MNETTFLRLENEELRKQLKNKSTLCYGLNESAEKIHANNRAKGFWDGEKNVGELLMLVVSELGEAIDAHRKDMFADKTLLDNHYENASWADKKALFKFLFESSVKDTFEDEIADAVIRLLDLCAGLGIDLEWHIRNKVEYNKTREKLHGKKY